MQLLKKKTGQTTGEQVPQRAKKRKFRTKTAVVLILVLALLAGAGIGAKALFFTAEEKVALTETTTYGALSTAIEGTATTLPSSSVTVTAASTAKIEAVYVAAGDTVAVGDPLYTQDDAELDDQIEEYQDEIADLEDELTSSYEQLSDLQETLSDLTVSAPFAGRLTEVSAEAGDSVQKGSKLAVLVDDSEMTLTQYFSYSYESQICLGMSAGVSVADLMTNLTGTVTDIQKVERITTEGERCFAVTVTVANPGALTEGMTGAGWLMGEGGEKLYPAVEGTLDYSRSKTLTAAVSGELTAVNAVAYQKVSAGEALFTVDGSDYQTQLTTANKKIAQTEERISSYQDKIAETEEKRSDYTVTSEIAGKVIMVNVRAGEKPRQAGQTAVSIYNLDTMTISANIDELDIDSIEMGMSVRIVRSGAETNTTYEGTVTEVSYEATNSSGVAYFPITVEIESGGELSAGVNVSYYITTGEDSEGVLAPLSALKSTTQGTCLFVKSDASPDNAVDLEDGTVPDGFYAVPVEVGTTNSRYARILSGVEAETEVFTRYQNSAPSNGTSTSQGQDGDESGTGNGNWGGGQMPDFSGGGGGRPDFSGGMMPMG